MQDAIKKIMDELVKGQQDKLLKCGRDFVPKLTSEDILQPFDYPELENNPHFRYEEGVLEGMQTVYTALLCVYNEQTESVI